MIQIVPAAELAQLDQVIQKAKNYLYAKPETQKQWDDVFEDVKGWAYKIVYIYARCNFEVDSVNNGFIDETKEIVDIVWVKEWIWDKIKFWL